MEKTLYMNEAGYEMLNKILDDIQDTASSAILNKSPRDCCMSIGTLVLNAKQVLKNEICIVPAGAGPDAA